MERILLKMASQLNSYDESSLMALWDKYATTVEQFEPTKRWEDAAIVFSLIQAVRLKNQLFNQHLAAGLERAHSDGPLPGQDSTKTWFEQRGKKTENAPGTTSEVGAGDGKPKKRCKVLRFSRRKSD
jgi:hypothetical protein